MKKEWFLLILGLILGVLLTTGFFMIEHDIHFGSTGCDLIRPQESCLDELFETCDKICQPQIKDLEERIEWLEDVADIYGDTWREGDCGTEIWRQQEEAGIVPFEVWKNEWG